MHLHQDGDWCCCLRLPFDSDKIGLAQCLSSQQILSCNNCTAWVFYLVTICTAHCSCNICYKLTLYLYICESKNSTCVEILKLLYRFIINGVVFYIVFLQVFGCWINYPCHHPHFLQKWQIPETCNHPYNAWCNCALSSHDSDFLSLDAHPRRTMCHGHAFRMSDATCSS